MEVATAAVPQTQHQQQQLPLPQLFVPPSPLPFASPTFATPAPYQGVLRFGLDTPQTVDLQQIAKEEGMTDPWLEIVKQFGRVRWLRARHQPAAVLAAVKGLDERQRNSPTARIENGRALAEQGDYGLAAREFAAVRKSAPWRCEGMEV